MYIAHPKLVLTKADISDGLELYDVSFTYCVLMVNTKYCLEPPFCLGDDRMSFNDRNVQFLTTIERRVEIVVESDWIRKLRI